MFINKGPFSEYLLYSRQLIENSRQGCEIPGINSATIMNANTPFELLPSNLSHGKTKIGALLIHGLFDSPFTLREIGLHLQQQNVLCRSVLLPGHGTHPNDLLNVSWQDWAATVAYGIESLQQQVDQLFLIGYSTGATLSLHQAAQNPNIAGLVLLSPAIKIKMSIDIISGWQRLINLAGKNKDWLCKEAEIDYAKYRSIPFHPIYELCKLTDTIEKQQNENSLNCPVIIAMSREDQTVSCQMAIEFFNKLPHPSNRFLLYSHLEENHLDNRIIHRPINYAELGIEHLSHSAIPFSTNNCHYGQHGDYALASHLHLADLTYGSFNQVEIDMFSLMHKFGLVKKKKQELTYNPDFDYMADFVTQFILSK